MWLFFKMSKGGVRMEGGYLLMKCHNTDPHQRLPPPPSHLSSTGLSPQYVTLLGQRILNNTEGKKQQVAFQKKDLECR
jgi:hypothetical protein